MATKKKASATTEPSTTSDETGSTGDVADAVLTTAGARSPETGPSNAGDKTVNLTGPNGTKVTAPARMAGRLKAQGYK